MRNKDVKFWLKLKNETRIRKKKQITFNTKQKSVVKNKTIRQIKHQQHETNKNKTFLKLLPQKICNASKFLKIIKNFCYFYTNFNKKFRLLTLN